MYSKKASATFAAAFSSSAQSPHVPTFSPTQPPSGIAATHSWATGRRELHVESQPPQGNDSPADPVED